MSRFFKSAAFPILIVIVLAILATKLIGSGSSGPHYTFGNLLQQLDNKQVQKLTLNQKSNSAEVTLDNGQKYTVGYHERVLADADQRGEGRCSRPPA